MSYASLADKVITPSPLCKWVNCVEVIPESPQFKAFTYLPAHLGINSLEAVHVCAIIWGEVKDGSEFISYASITHS